MKYDVIIIGSGLGGLECAHILSSAGKSVLVLEQAGQAGGCIQSYTRRKQKLDTGFHYVGGLDEGQSLHNVFGHLGLLSLPWQKLDDEFDRILIGNRSFALAQGYDSFVDRLAAEFPAERAALTRYADKLKRSLEQQFALLNPTTKDLSGLQMDFETNAWQYLQKTFHDPMLVNVLSAASLKMELRMESLPLFTFVHGNSSFIESSWRLKGDGSLIVDALTEGIHARGGEIQCNAGVTELVERNGKIVRAHCANGEAYEADLFISDIHPARICSLIKGNRKAKSYYKRIERLQNTYGMFTVSAYIKPDTLKYFNYNQYIYKRPDVWTFHLENAPVSGVLVSCRIPETGSEYVRQIDLLTPMSWDRCKAWEHTLPGHRGDDYKAMKNQLAHECISLAERAIPGLHRMIDDCYTSTPLTYHSYLDSPEGTAYGVRKDCRNPLMTMLSVRTPLPNLLLTGQNLILHGVHGVTVTSLFTCAEILGKDPIWNLITN